MTDSSSLQINDHVFVPNTANANDDDGDTSQLEGVILFIGPVPELLSGGDSDTDGESYFGIRLTGASAGMGVNYDTLQIQNYFPCPSKCALFVPSSTIVTKRTLTKLEALRLRRELASSIVTGATSTIASTSTTAATASATATTSSKTPVLSFKQPTTSSATATPAKTSGTAAMSRLEELRLRREAIKAAAATKPTIDTSSITPTKTSLGENIVGLSPEPSPLLSGSNKNDQNASVIVQQNSRIDDLTQQLAMRDKETIDVKNELQKVKEQSKTYKTQILELQKNVETASKQQSLQIIQKVDVTQGSNEIDELQDRNLQLQASYAEIKDQLEALQNEVTSCRDELKETAISHEAVLVELTRSRAEATSYQNQLRAHTDQNDLRGTSDAVHYKERAKLSADISALKRKIEQYEREKIDLEAAIEDLTLDKEQLQEEKDAIQEKYEDIKLDHETAQMEVEELRIELEDAKATAGRVMGVADTLTAAAMASAGSPSKAILALNDPDIAEMVQSLQTQNARLREALIRLREQSTVEKMEMTRQLRSVEKVVETNTSVQNRVGELTAINQNLNEQINDLKDMVEQGAAFEGMVEDLSDRVMGLEEHTVVLNTIIRELEDAGELTAEMEEVQADELKALSCDLEGRDTTIRNLEEAIKMQRRREDDFRRTVGNYKTTVDTLRQEKQALLELQQGGEGEKNSLVASSQKALSRAAQLVSEAANMRKREAEAVVDRINHTKYRHLSNRLESMLPQNVVSVELATVKGEIMASTISSKASNLLSGINSSFQKSIKPPLPRDVSNNDEANISEPLSLTIIDEIQQDVLTAFHQADFGLVIADTASDIIRLIAAGQWPDLLSAEASTELGTIVGHTLQELDEAFSALLKTLKEEGSLTIEQASVGMLQLAAQKTVQSLRVEIERNDNILVDSVWNPPGWALMRDITRAKFACLGTAAALSLVLDSNTQNARTQSAVVALYSVVEQCTSYASNVSCQLHSIDLMDSKKVGILTTMCSDFVVESMSLMNAVRGFLTSNGDMEPCDVAGSSTLRSISKIATEFRSRNSNLSDDETFHPLSPEYDDHWGGITGIVSSIRSIDGDSEDINYLLRSKTIEQRLGDAVENEPKLAAATTRISNLETSLSSRTKELAIQNARLSELEKLIAKTSATPLGRGSNFDFRTSDEYSSLQEENRVLTEAMDVLQREVETYENEIRSLKDFKSPKRATVSNSRATPIKSSSSLAGPTPNFRGTGNDAHSNIGLEATLFRPALQQALQDAAHWKSRATASALLDLPPLPITPMDLYGSGSSMFSDESILMSSALAKARIEKATITLVDLRNKEKAPRVQLREMKAKRAAIADRLDTVFLRYRGHLTEA